MKKRLVMAALSVIFSFGVTVQPAQAASALDILVSGGAAMVYVTKTINKMDEEGQAESLARTKERTGYYEDEAYQARVRRIMDTLSGSSLVKRSYAVYVNPEKEFNAFMTIGAVMSLNKGALDALDDDALAYVMAHEIAHGEHKDVVSGLKKQIGTQTALSIVAAGNTAGELLAGVTSNYLSNQVFTMGQEKKADEKGFLILADSPYNIGGAAAAMAILRDAYGDHYREGISQVLAPNNHPKTSDRVKNNIKRLYEYSGKKVDVVSGTVRINGKDIYAPEARGNYTGEVRAYLMAGKLARLYHDGTVGEAYTSGSIVYIGELAIVGTENEGEALRVAEALNAVSGIR